MSQPTIDPPITDQHHNRCPRQDDNLDSQYHEDDCPPMHHMRNNLDGPVPWNLCVCECTCDDEEYADYWDAGERQAEKARDEGC